MIRAANAVFLCALGIWVGGMVTLGFFVAPIVFQQVPSRLQAGTVFGTVLHAFGFFQLALGAVSLVSLIAMRLAGGLGGRRALLRIGGVSVMLVLVLTSQFYLAPEIVQERNAIVNFDSIPTGTPAKARFDRLHRLSVRCAGATLLLGMALLGMSAATTKPSDGA